MSHNILHCAYNIIYCTDNTIHNTDIVEQFSNMGPANTTVIPLYNMLLCSHGNQITYSYEDKW